MEIQILYFEGCPNHRPAVELVGDVVAALNVTATIEEIEIKGPEDAEQLRFLGSPSILVDGLDVEPGARQRTDYGFSCRTYDGKGLPSRATVVVALSGEDNAPRGGDGARASESCCAEREGPILSRKSKDSSRWAMGGSVIAAVLASSCCWLPLLLIAFGISASGLGTFFEQTRPVFLGTAAVLLTAGFYFSYIRKETCEPGSACATPNLKLKRVNRVLFWVATIGVVVFATFPSYVGVFQPSRAGDVTDVSAIPSATVTLRVEGMSCEGCTATVYNELAKVTGVLDTQVQFEQGKALITVDTSSPPSTASLIAAVEKAGYIGSLIGP